MIILEKGNLLDADTDFICHQVNCRGKMGSGVAGQIRGKWPIVYTEYFDFFLKAPEGLLGKIQPVIIPKEEDKNQQIVINMFAQQSYGYDGNLYTSYDAFWSCLQKIKNFVPTNQTIAFPYKIGCGLGGADWEVIYKMIEVTFTHHLVKIYCLED